MRLIQTTVPDEVLDQVSQALDERNIDYFATQENGTDQYAAVLYISLPEESVESVLELLYNEGLSSDEHVVLINTEVDIFGQAEEVSEGEDEGHARIAAAELQGKTEDLIPDTRTFITMMVLSTVVATTGVLLDSAAVVVGSMVLAPLFGPAASASVGTVIDDSNLFWRGVVLQVVGITIAVLAASVFAWIMKTAYLLPSGFALTAAPQVVERLSPDLLSLVVALVAGTAGVISIATAAGRALVGVMMAAALLPPAAIVGIGFAWGEPVVAFHSGILLAVNLLAINFAGLVTLWYLGYRPRSWIKIPQTRRALVKRGGVLLVAILIASAFLWNVTYANAQRSQIEDALQEEVSALVASEKYDDVTLIDLSVQHDRASLTNQPETVAITIGRPPQSTHPDLHKELSETVRERVERDINIEIHVSLLVDTDGGEAPSQSPPLKTIAEHYTNGYVKPIGSTPWIHS